MKRTLGLVALLSLSLTLGGCAQSNMLPTATPTPTLTKVTGAKAKSDFKSIVDASMALGDKEGLTQNTNNSKYGLYTLVLDRSYSDSYQAAVQNPDGSVEIIYESDAFSPYGASTSLSFGGTTVEELGNQFTITEDIEGSPAVFVYTVQNGVIVREEYTDATNITVTSDLLYTVTPLNLQILKKAIAELGQ